MSQVDELLNGLTDEQIAAYSTGSETEPHIIIGEDRVITVPDELKRIAVQFDHNVETVTFDCPRYWDEHDMSKMAVYINYKLPNDTLGSYIADEVTVDENDDTVMHFKWTISNNITNVPGKISFLVCIKKTDGEGIESNHWNSELNQDLFVSPGLECEVVVGEENPDIITQLLTRMDTAEEFLVTNVDNSVRNLFFSTDQLTTVEGLADMGGAYTGSHHIIHTLKDSYEKISLVFDVTQNHPVSIRVNGNLYSGRANATLQLPEDLYASFNGFVNMDTVENPTKEEIDTIWKAGSAVTISFDNVPTSGIAEFAYYATKEYVDKQIGDIDTALDSIIAIQENLIGGDSE